MSIKINTCKLISSKGEPFDTWLATLIEFLAAKVLSSVEIKKVKDEENNIESMVVEYGMGEVETVINDNGENVEVKKIYTCGNLFPIVAAAEDIEKMISAYCREPDYVEAVSEPAIVTEPTIVEEPAEGATEEEQSAYKKYLEDKAAYEEYIVAKAAYEEYQNYLKAFDLYEKKVNVLKNIFTTSVPASGCFHVYCLEKFETEEIIEFLRRGNDMLDCTTSQMDVSTLAPLNFFLKNTYSNNKYQITWVDENGEGCIAGVVRNGVVVEKEYFSAGTIVELCDMDYSLF